MHALVRSRMGRLGFLFLCVSMVHVPVKSILVSGMIQMFVINLFRKI